MYADKRLTEVFNSSEKITFDDASKIVIISDCHRGDGGWADDFSKNQNLYLAALNHYYGENYIYIELGDGDELWAKNRYCDITYTYNEIFRVLYKFYNQNRFYMLFGNHDIDKKNHRFVKNNLYRFYDDRKQKQIPLFENIKVLEGIILKYKGTDNKIFLLHGHQADYFNERLWKLSRFLVRYLWKPLELVGIKDPTSSSKNHKKKEAVEKYMIEWVKKNNQMIITGHTHRQVFPKAGEPPYFNDGCCVYPYCITAIEIDGGEIMFVKWYVSARNDGTLFADREVLAGPNKLSDYF